MKSWLILTVLTLIILNLSGLTVETASLRSFLYGRTQETAYDNFYGKIVEGLASEGYNQYAPWERQTNGFGTFIRASNDQLTQWGTVIAFFLAEQIEDAEDALAEYGFPYEIVLFNDTDTERSYYMLRELVNMEYFDDNGVPENPELHQHGSFDFGWGLYIFDPDSTIPIIVNTPHPKDDFITITVSAEAFQQWNARYFMINGAGREALWNNQPPFNNGKSRSDPTRNTAHPFNTAYRAFCDEIRNTFGRQEFSTQIHSFDYTHMGYKSLQIALGSVADRYPNLPIRDLSGNNRDIINASPYIIHPANSIGTHNDVLVTDYYAVYYDTHGLFYYYEDQAFPISNRINLTGISGPQFEYTFGSNVWNRFDVFSPFFHIEMEELPSIYPQTMAYYKWFYGYDVRTQRWDTENHFTNALAYYKPWIEALGAVIPDWLFFDDGTPPETPVNLRITNDTGARVSLSWERSYDYDFYSYEVITATEPFNFEEPNFNSYNRSNLNRLAGQAYTTISFTSLNANSEYYFAVRAVDYNGNFSDYSNVVVRNFGSARISNVKAIGRDGNIEVSWTANSQTDNMGFNIWRAVSGTDEYERIDSWETNDFLAGTETPNFPYGYIDEDIINGDYYDYMISAVSTEMQEHFFYQMVSASAQRIFTLHIANADSTFTDTIEFGVNPFTDDTYDTDFDILKGSQPPGDYVYGMVYYTIFGSLVRSLQRNILGFYNPEVNVKSWPIRIRSNQTNQPFTISISDNYFRNSEKLYMKCNSTGNIVNLVQEDMFFQVSNTNYRTFVLYWGNLQPEIELKPRSNFYLAAGDSTKFYWEVTDFPLLVDEYELYLDNGSDSLFVGNVDIQPLPDSLAWHVPEDITIFNANLYLKATMGDGDVLIKKSNYKLSVVEPNHNFISNEGSTLVTNPFYDLELNRETVFGENSELFYYNTIDGIYEEIDEFNFGTGYWLETADQFNYLTNGAFKDTTYVVELVRGWNLVPNMLLETIEISDLRFVNNNESFSYAEAVMFNLIENGIWKLNEGTYGKTKLLEKSDAFLLYNHIDNLQIHFIPFNQAPNTLQFDSEWTMTICASIDNSSQDDVVIASTINSTEGYNLYYDQPKPPKRPNSKLHFYLYSDLNNHRFPMMQIQHKPTITDENEVSLWKFVMEIGDLEDSPIMLTHKPAALTENWRVKMIIDEEEFILSEDEEQVFYPSSEYVTGQIMLYYEPPTGIDNDSLNYPSMLIANYPNPFFSGQAGTRSGGTNINFFINKKDNVKLEIFNIKGQRVIVLIDEEMDAGKHQVHWGGHNNQGKNVTAGIYFYRLSVANKVVSHRKMLLLK